MTKNSPQTPLEGLLRDQPKELASAWQGIHEGALFLETDVEAVRNVHGRAPAFLAALLRAKTSKKPDDWAGFSHREAIQLLTLMAHSLVDGGASLGAVGALMPSLVAALESAGCVDHARWVTPLSVVAADAAGAAHQAAHTRREQHLLAKKTPVLLLPKEVVVVTAMGAPDERCAETVADRAMKTAMRLKSPFVILDLTHVYVEQEESMMRLFSLLLDVRRIGGKGVIVSRSDPKQKWGKRAGLSLEGVEVFSTLREALDSRNSSFLWRLKGLWQPNPHY